MQVSQLSSAFSEELVPWHAQLFKLNIQSLGCLYFRDLCLVRIEKLLE